MAIKNQLWWRKYRPKTVNNMVLLPRIKKVVENGIQQDMIFYGHPGTGKSALIEILLKDKNYMKINASMENGIDTLRDKITDFCESMPSPFVRSEDKMKYVYLEEFDRTTPAFQDGFKAFVENYDHKVRFIISMNDITRVIPALISRLKPQVCFNPANEDEKAYLMNGYFKYLLSIVKHNKLNIDEDIIKKVMVTNFPDLRASVQELQTMSITGTDNVQYVIRNIEVFNFILNGKNDFSDNFYFVMDNWANQPKDLIDILSRPFYNYLLNNHGQIINEKGFELLELTKKYNAEFEFTTDPPLHVFSLICEMKSILIKKTSYSV
jgi:replication-associated recombination protein RarA